MATVRFNIPEAFERVYGIYAKIPIFFPKQIDSQGSIPEFNQAGDPYQDPAITDGTWSIVAPGTGLLLWDSFVLTIPTDAGPRRFQLPVETVAELRTRKQMVVTPLAGRDGTVKELIAAGDWEITFKGFCINYQEDTYPSSQVKELKELYDSLTAPRSQKGVMTSVQVTSKQLNDLGIMNMVLQELSFPPMAGYQNACGYELSGLSDNDIVLDLQLLENA